MANKHVTIIGGGVAGLSAALQLAKFDVQVDVVEQNAFLGGHAIRLACKATERCVKCGACMVEEKLHQAQQMPGIRLLTETQLNQINKDQRFSLALTRAPQWIDPEQCNDCGVCRGLCPADAIIQGTSSSHRPFYAIDRKKCTRSAQIKEILAQVQDGTERQSAGIPKHSETSKEGPSAEIGPKGFSEMASEGPGDDCQACQDGCPQNAIHLDREPSVEICETDAVILTTGFTPFRPHDKPYGYQRFANVMTNLELEETLRHSLQAIKRSDGSPVKKVAFVQCVGSRDAKLNHLWCSRVCCGSSLRLARLIQHRQADTAITVFYIDIQNFGKDFEPYYQSARETIRFERAIPGDIFQREDGRLQVTFVDSMTHAGKEEDFDLVVLAVGLCPPEPIETTDRFLKSYQPENDFIQLPQTMDGIFAAGAATGPMTIAESVASAEAAAWSTIQYLGLTSVRP